MDTMLKKPTAENGPAVKKVARHGMDEQDPDVAQQHGAAGDVGHHARAEMDQIVAVDRRREADEADRDDAGALADRGQDGVQRLSARHQARSRHIPRT